MEIEVKIALIASILKAEEATRYSSPKRILIASLGNIIIKRNKGRLIIKIHLPTCFVSSFIRVKFFLEYSLVINGKKSCKKISDAILKRPAIGRAAL